MNFVIIITGIIIREITKWVRIFGIITVMLLTLYLLGLLPNDPLLEYIENHHNEIQQLLIYINYISYANVVVAIANFLVFTFPLVWLVRIIMNYLGTKEK
jgi:di/tricarboxylate transporter